MQPGLLATHYSLPGTAAPTFVNNALAPAPVGTLPGAPPAPPARGCPSPSPQLRLRSGYHPTPACSQAARHTHVHTPGGSVLG